MVWRLMRMVDRLIGTILAGIFVCVIPVLAMLAAGKNGAFAWLLAAVTEAGGDAPALMGASAGTLAAISMGAVYMGALTYIGNAPNFMIYAIASERGVKMPSFFGYLLWACVVLLPVFALLTRVSVGRG